MKYYIPLWWIFGPNSADTIIEKQNILILSELFEKLIIMVDEDVNNSHIFISIVQIHQSKLQKTTFLFVKTKQRVDFKKRKRTRLQAYLTSFIFCQIKGQQSYKVIVAFHLHFDKLLKDKLAIKSFHYQTQGVPFNISLIFVGIV